MSAAEKPNTAQRELLRTYDQIDGRPAGPNGKSLSAMVRRGWMEELPAENRPGWIMLRRWRTTDAGRKAKGA